MKKKTQNKVEQFRSNLSQYILGQEEALLKLCIGVFSGGHILLEGVPGLAKTAMVKTIAKLVGLDFKRISCTPDLLPSDLIGVNIYNPSSKKFSIHKGPIFTQILLVDEINRAPAKVQSALLECMQEKTATIGEKTFAIDKQFITIATQNPIDEEGIYILPLAQKDRFMMKVLIDYPSSDADNHILDIQNFDERIAKVKTCITQSELLEIRKELYEVFADEKLLDYLNRLIYSTRDIQAPKNHHKLFRVGASPRSAQNLLLAAKSYAFLTGFDYVIPDHIHAVFKDVMRHRLLVDYFSDIETIEDSLQYVLDTVEIY